MKKKVRHGAYTYSVVLIPAEEGGYTVTVPALPGCITEGDTLEESLSNAKEAIQLTIECLRERGEKIPTEPSPSLTSIVSVGSTYA